MGSALVPVPANYCPRGIAMWSSREFQASSGQGGRTPLAHASAPGPGYSFTEIGTMMTRLAVPLSNSEKPSLLQQMWPPWSWEMSALSWVCSALSCARSAVSVAICGGPQSVRISSYERPGSFENEPT